jgi:hypothetical protein
LLSNDYNAFCGVAGEAGFTDMHVVSSWFEAVTVKSRLEFDPYRSEKQKT